MIYRISDSPDATFPRHFCPSQLAGLCSGRPQGARVMRTSTRGRPCGGVTYNPIPPVGTSVAVVARPPPCGRLILSQKGELGFAIVTCKPCNFWHHTNIPFLSLACQLTRGIHLEQVA